MHRMRPQISSHLFNLVVLVLQWLEGGDPNLTNPNRNPKPNPNPKPKIILTLNPDPKFTDPPSCRLITMFSSIQGGGHLPSLCLFCINLISSIIYTSSCGSNKFKK